jgi:hypothetical protein
LRELLKHLPNEQHWLVAAMSALPPKADIVQYDDNVRFVPKADTRDPWP